MAKDRIKHDVEANWDKAVTFIPKQNEIIIYEPDEKTNYFRVKVGDGYHHLNNLPFETSDMPRWKTF